MKPESIQTDVLVVGGGAAGSRAAYEAKRLYPHLKVLMAVNGGFGTSGSTNLIASESLGINAPFNAMKDGDSPDVFYNDILETGAGLSDPALCRVIADEACDRINELIALGLSFETDGKDLVQRKLSGCRKARSLTCGGSTGRAMVAVLKREIGRQAVEVRENTQVVDLIRDEAGRVCGGRALIGDRPVSISSGAVILASGGAGRIFRHNVNPPSVEGDGWSMAYRAGARLVNMEFFQVGPAVFNAPFQFIIHSHMWRLRPRLTNALGEEFLSRYCPPAVDPAEVLDLKAMSYPFSVRTAAKYLDIAVFKEVMSGRGTPAGAVWFDVTHVGRDTLAAKAPITYRTFLQAGIDLATKPIEVGMVVQNFNGGVLIDADGFTGIEGLFAAGEVTGGVHGADRPGGNNLIDTQVFGYRAGRAAAEYVLQHAKPTLPADLPKAFELRPASREEEALLARSAELYYAHLTVVRTRRGIQEVLDFNAGCRGRAGRRLQDRLTVGSLLATAALVREESRGTHYREDFPQTDPAWQKRIVLAKSEDGTPRAAFLP